MPGATGVHRRHVHPDAPLLGHQQRRPWPAPEATHRPVAHAAAQQPQRVPPGALRRRREAQRRALQALQGHGPKELRHAPPGAHQVRRLRVAVHGHLAVEHLGVQQGGDGPGASGEDCEVLIKHEWQNVI